MSTKIALAGNPNSGKTTVFNSLTGSSQYVGNWPGVTVEKKSGKLKGYKDVEIIDLPGIYSLSPYTLEEVIARDYLAGENPDAVINIVDSTNIERNLYLTTQLLEMNIPTVIALNMADLLEKQGDQIDVAKLSDLLGCPIIKTAALKGQGCREAAQTAIDLAAAKTIAKPLNVFSTPVEKALADIETLLASIVPADKLRWYAIKVFERDEKARAQISLDASTRARAERITAALEEALDDDGESIITNERYTYIATLMKSAVKKRAVHMTVSDKIDRIVTNRFMALPIFAAVMFLIYYISISTVGTFLTDWVNESLFGEIIPGAVEAGLEALGTAEWLNSLILDGLIAGVGAVLGFLPQMLVLFLLLAILEDSGYMARIAFIMDRIFRKFGLSGKSFIPILIGTGCGVPGIMASRTIENDRDRKMTVITTTFIPCSAKLPIIALIAGALFPDATWVAPSAYFLGIGAIIASGIILKKTRVFAGDPAPFVMELPPYHVPGVKGVLIHMWDRGKSFVKKAGTIIFASSALVWFLSSFSWTFQMVETPDSMLASIGSFIAPIFSPLGWGEWRSTVATITGLIAKENVVGTFGILYGFAEVAEDGMEIWTTLRLAFTQLSAYSFLIFNLLCAPCFAAVGAIHREMGTPKWTLIAIGYQTIFAYVIAFIYFQLGSVFTGGAFGFYTVLSILLAGMLLYLLFRPSRGGKTAPKPKEVVT